MSFLSPLMLWGLLALVPVILIQLFGYLRGRQDLARLSRHVDSDEAQTLYLVKWFFSALSLDLFLVLAVLALANPTWGEEPVEEDRESLDIVVSLDISRSMLADDVAPSRLGRSLTVVRSVSRQLPSARFAVVAFKGDSSVLLPLTEDLNALETVLDGVRPELISAPGTDLERGLTAALDAFPDGSNAHQSILLISDGESLSGAPERAADRARRLGIPVVTVVAGTAEGSTLTDSTGAVVTDEDGRPVISRAEPAALSSIAEATGSLAVSLSNVELVSDIVRFLDTHVETRESAGYRLVAVQRYPLFIAAALIMLILSVSVRVFRWKELF